MFEISIGLTSFIAGRIDEDDDIGLMILICLGINGVVPNFSIDDIGFIDVDGTNRIELVGINGLRIVN